MELLLDKSWLQTLKSDITAKYFEELLSLVDKEYLSTAVFPPPELVFNAFSACTYNRVRVVIIGQDPYHDHGQAHGLAFSVPDGVPIPPSLRNIFKELASDIGIQNPTSGNLERWAEQGVLLLNSTLTVEAHKPGSHQGLGWEQFTDAVIKKISDNKEHVVFLLWGTFAQSKRTFIDESKHLVLTAPHPSPLSAYRGFLGCKHFSSANNYLRQHKLQEIIW